jgi:hypothetical protein|eukprot:3422190-Prymnesium_polylepis.1
MEGDGTIRVVPGLNGEEVDHRTLVDHVPVGAQLTQEPGKEGGRIRGLSICVDVRGMHNLQVVNIDANGKYL